MKALATWCWRIALLLGVLALFAYSPKDPHQVEPPLGPGDVRRFRDCPGIGTTKPAP